MAQFLLVIVTRVAVFCQPHYRLSSGQPNPKTQLHWQVKCQIVVPTSWTLGQTFSIGILQTFIDKALRHLAINFKTDVRKA